MRIAWIGGQFFRSGMAAQGVKHVAIGHERPEVLFWDDIVERCGGTAPDAVLYADRSLPPPIGGLATIPVPTVFHCIDSHIHSWYPAYAQGFDLVSVSLRDHLGRFSLRLPPDRILWLPPHPMDDDVPPADPPEKKWDLLFVGKVDPETTPERHRFLAELAGVFDGLHVCQGNYRQLFPQGRVVLNIAERGDLNFRVFEALGCGACLLTPAIGNGQDELFADGEHLATYPFMDAEALAARARELLADDPLRRRLARQGNELINARHRCVHRAASLMEHIRSHDLDALVADRLANARAIHNDYLKVIYLHWAEAHQGQPLAEKYLRAALRP